MANIDFYVQGTDADNYALGKINSQVYAGVVDVVKLDADTAYASLDVLRLVKFEQGTVFEWTDIEITDTLVNVTAVDFGNTISSATDPDDYVNNSTATAIGRLTSYEAAAVATTVLSADGFIALRLTGTFSGAATGKLAWRVKLTKPAKLATDRMEPRTYPN